MTRREAPLSVLKDLAEAVDREFRDGNATADVRAALSAYRAATAPLRSRAEVDAEIIPLLRQHVVRITGMTKEQMDGIDFRHAWDRIKELCREPTSDPDPSGPGDESAPSPASVAGATLSGPPTASATKESSDNAGAAGGAAIDPGDERACGCEQSESLLQRLGRIRALAVTYPSNEPHTALGAIRKVCG